ncbi:MAG: thiopeptide-type bacteriocin biosynthesis protein [Salibacteraceae bacterium]|jgi:thiopeptide-type bacteriocin biosynthesis protein
MVTLCAVHRAIKTKIKGSTSEIAEQIGISRSSFYQYIDQISEYGVAGINNYLDLFSFSLAQKSSLLTHLSTSFFSEFNGEKKQKVLLDKKYRVYSDRIHEIISGADSEEVLSHFDKVQFKESVNIIESNLLTNDGKYDLVSSYIHMFLNRLFLSNPRYNEMFVYYLLSKHYSRIYRLAQKNHK